MTGIAWRIARMKWHRLVASAICCWLVSLAAGPADIRVDVGALSDTAVAARVVPSLARELLATNVPDRETRIRLLLAAGDPVAANALMDRLNTLDAVRLESALTDTDPFGSWSKALARFKGRVSLSVNEAIELASAYAPETNAAGVSIEHDATKRFAIARVSIPSVDGVQLAGIVVRPRGNHARLPAALVFTIYAQPKIDTLRAEYGAA